MKIGPHFPSYHKIKSNQFFEAWCIVVMQHKETETQDIFKMCKLHFWFFEPKISWRCLVMCMTLGLINLSHENLLTNFLDNQTWPLAFWPKSNPRLRLLKVIMPIGGLRSIFTTHHGEKYTFIHRPYLQKVSKNVVFAITLKTVHKLPSNLACGYSNERCTVCFTTIDITWCAYIHYLVTLRHTHTHTLHFHGHFSKREREKNVTMW